MIVFKFGGASVKDPEAVKNVSSVIQLYNNQKLLVVVSAMGKTTNALERVWRAKMDGNDAPEELRGIEEYHLNIVRSLFKDHSHPIYTEMEVWFENLRNILSLRPDTDPNRYYDTLISFGEIISSCIVGHFLNQEGIATEWLDARDFIETDNTYREGKVDWEATEQRCLAKIPKILQTKIIITQGFIGRSTEGYTVTLGREGSDYTAAIFAACLRAEQVSIWKDVPGILNADPKIFKAAVKFDELSYQEAAEMTYYGASVIHPKTIKPLANKKIALWVKSFERPNEKGTVIHDCAMGKLPPCIIIKPNQCLVTFKVLDFTFIDENNLSIIFNALDQCNIKINMMQNTAISFSICIDNQEYKIKKMMNLLQEEFKILYNDNLELLTIKNFENSLAEELTHSKKVYLEQRSRSTFQAVMA